MTDTIKTVLIDGGSPVALSDEDTRFIYNLLPVGEFYDKRYGRVSITPEKVKQMVENFGKCPAYEVPVKLGHSDGAKSPGKVIGVEAKDNGLEITMSVDSETAKAINDKQYRYMSAEFDEDYHDKKTGERVGAVLLGAALVNQPAHPYVAPLVLADNIEGNDKSMSELEDLRRKLLEAETQKAQAEAELKAEHEKHSKEAEESAKKLSDMEAENKKLLEERDRIETARNEAEVKVCCETWLAEGTPPAVVDKLKPLMLAKTSRVIRLSDTEEKPIMEVLKDIVAVIPKVPLGQKSLSDAPATELSDTEKAIKRGEAIAAIVNGKEE